MTKEEEEKARKDAEEKAKADAAKMDADGKMSAILDGIAGISKACDAMRGEMDAMKGRMDAVEGGMPAGTAADKKDAEEKEAEEKAKKDAAEKEEKDRKDAAEAEEKSKADKAKKDAEEAEERKKADAARAADPAITNRLAAVEAAVKPRVAADANRLADAWSKANAISIALGDSNGASPAMPGENVDDYRRRILEPLKAHSDAWKGVDLAKLESAAFDVAESQIREAAMDAALSPSTVPAGGLREHRKQADGHTIVTWSGHPSAWMNQFAGTGQRVAGDWKRDLRGAR